MHLSKFIFNPFSVLYRTMRHHASPSRCRSVPRTTFALLHSALPCFTFATLCSAILHPCSTSHGTAFAAPNITMPSLAFALLCASLLRFTFALLHITSRCNSVAVQCFTQPRRAIAVPHFAFAMQCDALPSLRNELLCNALALRALPCLRHAMLRSAKQYLRST